MEVGSLVLCIDGHSPWVETGNIYTVSDFIYYPKLDVYGITLEEASPPSPKKSFKPERFIEIQKPMDVASIVDEIIYENENSN
jgi:hypothetical protein